MEFFPAGWASIDPGDMVAPRVFEKLYGTDELHCSKDGFTLQRPTAREMGVSPAAGHFDLY